MRWALSTPWPSGLTDVSVPRFLRRRITNRVNTSDGIAQAVVKESGRLNRTTRFNFHGWNHWGHEPGQDGAGDGMSTTYQTINTTWSFPGPDTPPEAGFQPGANGASPVGHALFLFFDDMRDATTGNPAGGQLNFDVAVSVLTFNSFSQAWSTSGLRIIEQEVFFYPNGGSKIRCYLVPPMWWRIRLTFKITGGAFDSLSMDIAARWVTRSGIFLPNP